MVVINEASELREWHLSMLREVISLRYPAESSQDDCSTARRRQTSQTSTDQAQESREYRRPSCTVRGSPRTVQCHPCQLRIPSH